MSTSENPPKVGRAGPFVTPPGASVHISLGNDARISATHVRGATLVGPECVWVTLYPDDSSRDIAGISLTPTAAANLVTALTRALDDAGVTA